MPANGFKRREYLERRLVLRASEREVLDEVGEAGATFRVVGGAYAVGDRHAHDRLGRHDAQRADHAVVHFDPTLHGRIDQDYAPRYPDP